MYAIVKMEYQALIYNGFGFKNNLKQFRLISPLMKSSIVLEGLK